MIDTHSMAIDNVGVAALSCLTLVLKTCGALLSQVCLSCSLSFAVYLVVGASIYLDYGRFPLSLHCCLPQVDRLSIDRLLLALALSSAHAGSVAGVDAEYRIAVLGALLASVNALSCEMSPALSLAVKIFRDGACQPSRAVVR